MALSIHVPRINNNDDEVKVVGLDVKIGAHVKAGQIIAQFETDKAVMDLESSNEGYVLAIYGEIDDIVKVGDIFIWLGENQDDAIPQQQASGDSENSTQANSPTAKARLLLKEYNLNAHEIPQTGTRLSVADIQNYITATGRKPVAVNSAPVTYQEPAPTVTGELKALKSEERGMLSTVLWHRDVAVPGYIEIAYDVSVWEDYAKTFGEQHSLLLSPLLPLMAWRLVELSVEMPHINATISGIQRYEYQQTNLGFTVQAGQTLYLTVVQQANALDALQFVNRMVELQRGAAAHTLGAQELQDATISFSSMSRWKVGRHIPILPPHTSLMIAHTVGSDGQGILGATYDHRVLNGGDVVTVLRKLSKPNLSN